MRKEIYFSVDVETNGPIPGPHSMWSIGAAAFSEEGLLLGTFSLNLHDLPGATGHPATMRFWSMNPSAHEKCRKDPVDPKVAMEAFSSWVSSFDGIPVFVAYPAGFDFTFVYWYLVKFLDASPFSFSALDIKTYAMAMLKTGYRESVKRNMPKSWFSDEPHTHEAVQDAIEQGRLFMAMFQQNKRLHK